MIPLLGQMLEMGRRARSVGTTNMNAASSRSHTIFTLSVERSTADGELLTGKLPLVDLAGSERCATGGVCCVQCRA